MSEKAPSKALIKVFKGGWRGLGGEVDSGHGMIFDFAFRQHLHLFQGARLHVLMSIVLHANEEGIAYPSYDLIQKETGYGRDTIANALEDLCTMIVEGQRVLCKYRERDEKGQFTGSNRYLIFPSLAECQSLENPTMDQSQKNPTLDNTTSGKTGLEVKPDSKDKPVLKDKLPAKTAGASEPDLEAPTIIKNMGAFLALKAFEESQRKGDRLDLASWPEDCRPWVQKFWELWQVQPPEPSRGKKGQFALWIDDSRNLANACGEFGFEVLVAIHKDHEAERTRTGQAPFMVARPGALIKAAMAKAGELRRARPQGPTDYRPGEKLDDYFERVKQERAKNEEYMAQLRAQRDAQRGVQPQ